MSFRSNPLGVGASYEEASSWLERASEHGSGEASEVLAQLITRMHANGHVTHYSAADSTRLHALARSQGFDVEAISVTCYKLAPGRSGITLGRRPEPFNGEKPKEPFTSDEIKAMGDAGIKGTLVWGGGSGNGDSVLLTRPEEPSANVRVLLDHDPGTEVLLPIPAHRDVIYVQHGNEFLGFPSGGKVLPRFINLTPQSEDMRQVSVFTELMDGGHSGGYCASFE